MTQSSGPSRVLTAAPPAPGVMAARVGKSASILSSARTPRLHVAARRHSAQVLCSKPSQHFMDCLLLACNGAEPPARGADGLRRIRSLNTLPMPQTSAAAVGRGRERGGAGRAGRSEVWNCTMCARQSVQGACELCGRVPGVRCNCVCFVSQGRGSVKFEVAAGADRTARS